MALQYDYNYKALAFGNFQQKENQQQQDTKKANKHAMMLTEENVHKLKAVISSGQ